MKNVDPQSEEERENHRVKNNTLPLIVCALRFVDVKKENKGKGKSTIVANEKKRKEKIKIKAMLEEEEGLPWEVQPGEEGDHI